MCVTLHAVRYRPTAWTVDNLPELPLKSRMIDFRDGGGKGIRQSQCVGYHNKYARVYIIIFYSKDLDN